MATVSITVAAPSNATPVVGAVSAGASPVTGTNTALSATADDEAGEAAVAYTWSVTGPAAVSFSANGTKAATPSTAAFTRAGSYILTVMASDAGGLSASRSVDVTAEVLVLAVVEGQADDDGGSHGTCGGRGVLGLIAGCGLLPLLRGRTLG